jgi:hypothetical protein
VAGLQLVARAVPVEGKAECLGACFHPRQVTLGIGYAFLRIEAHRLDEVEASVRIAHKGSLGQTFPPFVGGSAVGYYPRTEPHQSAVSPALSVRVRIATLNAARARPGAIAPPSRYRRRAGRSRARDDLHRADLGRSRDRAAGEDRLQDSPPRQALLESDTTVDVI